LEHEQKFGIFRYKNQAGIETNTIQVNNENIGFQAKFYETSVSSNKNDIIDSISKAKNKNPNINKIFLYVNKELGESSKKDKSKPKYQEEIENFAKNHNVELVWRVPSYFERQLIEPKNKWLYEVFFSLNKGIVDFVTEIERHSKNNVESVKTEISFNGSVIKFNRADIIKQLKAQLRLPGPTVIVGKGGCGKTAVIKDVYNDIKFPLFMFKAYEFNNKTSINELFIPFGHYTFNDFMEIYKDEPVKVMVIDSAEKLADIENINVFECFINNLIKNKWKIIFTTREAYLNDLISQLNNAGHDIPLTITLEPITYEQLNSLSQEYNFELPQDERLCELLTIPFYLSEYLKITTEKNLRLKEFKSSLWQKQIMNSKYTKDRIHLRREQTFIELIKQKNLRGAFIIHAKNADNEALGSLCDSEIIKYDEIQHGYFIVHDIYEEWGLEKFIDISYYDNISNLNQFLEELGTSLSVRRSFRNWLSEKLYDNDSKILSLIDTIINANNIKKFWQDEIFVSIMLSPHADVFIKQYKSQLLENDQALLLRTIFMLRIACKNIDYETLQKLMIDKQHWINLKYLMTIPRGNGWEYAIKFIYENIETLNDKHIDIIIPLLQDWVNKNKTGNGTKYAGKIALYYFHHTKLYNENLNNIIKVLLQSAYEIKSEIEGIYNEVLNGNNNYENNKIVEVMLRKPFEAADAIIFLPEKVLELAKMKWFLKDKQPNGFGQIPTSRGVDEYFGLNEKINYFPASALQTPILLLLKTHFQKTLDFIISVINETTKNYAASELAEKYDDLEKIKIHLDSANIVEQYCSTRLWNAYRGCSVTPYVLQSILMALETVLLEIAEEKDSDIIEPILYKILSNSNSVALTAVIASVVISQPDKLFNIAKILFNTWEFFNQDLHRKIQEQGICNLAGFYADKMLIEERKKSNNLAHRAKSLEDIALYYQLFDIKNCSADINFRRNELYKIWDNWYSILPKEDKQTEKDIYIRCTLARIDYRRLGIKVINKDDKTKQICITGTKEDPSLDKKRKAFEQEIAEDIKYMPLILWADNKSQNKDISVTKYNDNPHLAFNDMQEILQVTNPSDKFYAFYHATSAYTAAKLLKNHCNALSDDEKNRCKDVLLNYAKKPLDLNYNYQYSDGTEPAIETLDCIIKLFPKEILSVQTLLVFALFEQEKIREYAFNALSKIWNIDFEIAQRIWLAYLKYNPEYKEFYQNMWKLQYEGKFDKINAEYNKLITVICDYLTKKHSFKFDITGCDYDTLSVGFQILPNGSCNSEHLKFCSEIIPRFMDIFEKNYNYNEKMYGEALSRFSDKFAHYLLKLPKDKINEFVQPLLLKENLDKDFSQFLLDLFVAQDVEKEYEKFWYIWLLFYDKIKQICVRNSKYVCKEIIQNYLLAGYIMNIGQAKSWHSLKQENIKFYYNIANDIGQHPETLYSIAKVFNGIASSYIEDGVKIVYYLINTYDYEETDSNSINYVENLVRVYFILNKPKVQTNAEIKNRLINILTFLVNKGSVFGYMLRESIL